MRSKFNYSKENPFHISVAALLTNEEGLICTHFFKKDDLPDESEGKSDLYLLMRESLHDNETIEEGLTRGLMEEYGATGDIKRYIGSIQSMFPYSTIPDKWVEKTVLYFHIELTSIEESRREPNTAESKSTLLWLTPEELLEKFAQQNKVYERTDLDDSKIIKDFISYEK